jgi:signal transduction histidine kinase/ActR/RegA family two-component response regulator
MFSPFDDLSQLGLGFGGFADLATAKAGLAVGGDRYSPELVWISTAGGDLVTCDDVAPRFTAEEIQALCQDATRRLHRDKCVQFTVEMRIGSRLVAAQRFGSGRDAMCLGCVLSAPPMERGPGAPATSEFVARALAWAMLRAQGENTKLKTRAKHLMSENEAIRLAHAVTVEAAIHEREGRRRATKEKKAINKLYHAEEAANRSKNLFLATVSHELRTPLTAILGFTEILVGNLTEPENRDAALTVRRNGEHLLEIINDILDLCKLDADRLDIQPAPCAVAPLLQGVVSLMQIRADAKGLPLILEYEEPMPESIVTDATRLRQILINLIGNAVKFTETGSVRVVARVLRNAEEQPALQIDVVDTGIGITEDQIEGLFQPFAQATSQTHVQYGGTGLGLAISRRLAKMLGGDITVRSDIGRGSTFTVTISAGPVICGYAIGETPAEPATVPPAAVDESAPLQCRILLVEDGPDNQRLISFVLRKAGATVSVACNGAEAVEAVLGDCSDGPASSTEGAGAFDVVLMDLHMPVMDGYEATRRLRAAGFQRPIVALTAHTAEDAIQQAKNAGCSHYMSKPIDRKQLIELIRRCVAENPSG